MNHYTPTRGASDTGRNIRAFIKDNMQAFWDIMNPLLPYIIGLVLFDFIISIIFFPDAKKDAFNLGAVIANYFYAALIISWHRVVIHGPDQYVAVNPLKPTKNELVFMGMMILIGLGSLLIAGLFAIIFMLFGPAGIGIGAFVGVILGVYLGYKFSFYFPAKAANRDITLKESFTLTKGYFWKMAGASFLASWRFALIIVAYVIVIAIIAGVIFYSAGMGSPGFIQQVLIFATSLPMHIYFQPMLSIIGVTVLSNYYLYAIQSRQA